MRSYNNVRFNFRQEVNSNVTRKPYTADPCQLGTAARDLKGDEHPSQSRPSISLIGCNRPMVHASTSLAGLGAIAHETSRTNAPVRQRDCDPEIDAPVHPVQAMR